MFYNDKFITYNFGEKNNYTKGRCNGSRIGSNRDSFYHKSGKNLRTDKKIVLQSQLLYYKGIITTYQ